MKGKLLLVLALLIGLQSMAQTPTPYHTGFDNGSQVAGWVSFRKGFTTGMFDWSVGNYPNSYSPPACLSHDYPVGGAPSLVEDWWVSPPFDFSAGGAIDSMHIIVFAMGGSATVDDHFGVYLLAGSPDPAIATVTMLGNYTSMASNMALWTKISNIPIASTPGTSYIAFKYTATNNWFVPYVDNVNINANPNPCPAPASIAVTPSHLSADFSWPTVGTAIGYEVVVNTTATPPAGAGAPTSGTTHTEPGLLLNTNYYVHVRANCGGGLFSTWKTQSFKTLGGPAPCVEPQLSFPELTSTQAKVSWPAIPNSEGYEYTLKQTPETPSVSGTLILQNNLTLPSLTPATKYYLFVRNRCQGISSWIFSNWVTAEFFTHFPTGINEINGESVKLYPNPASDVLQIEGTPAKASVIITDMIGKQMLQSQSTENTTSLNISTLPAGLYLIKVTEPEGKQHTLRFQKQ